MPLPHPEGVAEASVVETGLLGSGPVWDPTPELEIPAAICETSQVALAQI